MTADLFLSDWRTLWGPLHADSNVGAIFTRREIVDLILDLSGYVSGEGDLVQKRILEPSCGDGAFTDAIVHRLLEDLAVRGESPNWTSAALLECIRAVDLNSHSVATARESTQELLVAAGCPNVTAERIAGAWFQEADFLLEPLPGRFDVIVGNPPYVRIEELPPLVLSAYRQQFETFGQRSDLYIAFFERALGLLSPGGRLAFICANRWTKNKYGEALRRLIARRHGVVAYLNLEHTQPFLGDVAAYPAIFVLSEGPVEETGATTLHSIDDPTLATVRDDLLGRPGSPAVVGRFTRWYPKGEPWVATDTASLLAHHRLQTLPVLEESAPGTRVGIGVATGADDVYILKGLHPEIEPELQLPLAVAGDVRSGAVNWSGRYLLNPFATDDSGSLIDLLAWPGARSYFMMHERRLRNRHVGKRNEGGWYRTIDRVWSSLQKTPKLLVPDIQTGNIVALEDGRFYPHHNLYWITSTTWPLRALHGLLMSREVLAQVGSHSVQMRGGSLRYQAQTLRRVRLPRLSDIPNAHLSELETLGARGPSTELDELAEDVFSRALKSCANHTAQVSNPT